MIEFLQLIEVIPVQWFSLAITILGFAAVVFAGWQIKLMKYNKELQKTLNECLKYFMKKGD